MTYRDPQRSNIAALVAGQTAGHYTLPARLLELLAREQQLRELRDGPADVRDDAVGRSGLAAEIVQVVLDGGGLPGDLAVRAHATVDAARRRQALVMVVNEALEDLDGRVVGEIQGMAAAIITDHLRPVLITTVAETRRLAPAFAAGIPGPESVPHLLPDAQRAYAELRGLTDRHQSIRRAQRLCWQLGGPPAQDSEGMFASLRNAPEVLGRSLVGRYSSSARPWPADPLGYLLWLTTVGDPTPEPWMPLPQEQDAAYRAWVDGAGGTGLRNRNRSIGVYVAPRD